MEIFASVLMAFLPIGFVACCLFIAVAILYDAKNLGRNQAFRNAFLAIVSFLSLFAVLGSLATAGYLGLRTWVFPDAYQQWSSYFYQPPSPPFDLKPDCTKETTQCPYNLSQKDSIRTWLNDYQNWQQEPAKSQHQGIIDAASIFAFSLPLFLIFFLWFRRTQDKNQNTTKTVYYYSVAFVSLMITVIAGGLLLNCLLKSQMLPETKNFDYDQAGRQMVSTASIPCEAEIGCETREETILTDLELVAKIDSCDQVCGLTAKQQELIKSWPGDYQATKDRSQTANRYHYPLAITIPLIVFALPVFLYHFLLIRKEDKKEKPEQIENK